MLAALAASGQTPSAFARAKGFGPYRVSYWRAKLAEAGEARNHSDGSFVEVAVRDEAPTRQAVTERWVEVMLPDGRVVTFVGTWDASALAPWLQALDGVR